jgi:hypothetical protein
VPDELRDERAWVWAGELNGTLWYYAGVPGYKLFWASPQVRALVYRFVHERGERQYLVNDSAAWRPFMEEIKAWGGTLEARGRLIRTLIFSSVGRPKARPNDCYG